PRQQAARVLPAMLPRRRSRGRGRAGGARGGRPMAAARARAAGGRCRAGVGTAHRGARRDRARRRARARRCRRCRTPRRGAMAPRHAPAPAAATLSEGARHDVAAARREAQMSRRLRPVEADDLPAVARLHALCFPEDSWDEKALGELLAMAGGSGHLVEDSEEGRPLGLIMDLILAADAEILTLAVTPDCRRQGIGRACWPISSNGPGGEARAASASKSPPTMRRRASSTKAAASRRREGGAAITSAAAAARSTRCSSAGRCCPSPEIRAEARGDLPTPTNHWWSTLGPPLRASRQSDPPREPNIWCAPHPSREKINARGLFTHCFPAAKSIYR